MRSLVRRFGLLAVLFALVTVAALAQAVGNGSTTTSAIGNGTSPYTRGNGLSAYAKTDLTATSISAPPPLPETTPQPLCIAGEKFVFTEGDDFTQETQAQFVRYTQQFEINQYHGPQPAMTGTSTWNWSDQLSGIGRANNAGNDDAYYVHIDDTNPANSYPGPWVNNVSPRPGAQIIGTPPNSYMLIRGVYAPPGHDADMNSRHWLSGVIEGAPFRYGYTETTAEFTAGAGWWPSDWTELAPGGYGFNGDGTGYQEFDTFEYFGGTQGLHTLQQTRIGAGTPQSEYVRPVVSDFDTAYHTYGQLWMPPINGNSSYIVYYIDRVPQSYYIYGAGLANMNPIAVLQIGTVGSFVSNPAPSSIGELKLKNYFTWQDAGVVCDATASANPIPTPTASPTPIPAPVIASNITPVLQPYNPPVVANGSKIVSLPTTPPTGALVMIQGMSGSASCPTGFTQTNNGSKAYLCTGIVGANGLVAAQTYNIGVNGFDVWATAYVTNVVGYTVNTDISGSWQSSNPATITKSQSATSNNLALAFMYAYGDCPRYATSDSLTSTLAFNKLYEAPADATTCEGEALLETSVAPSPSVSFTGTYNWTGTLASNGNDYLPSIYTVVIQ